MIQTGVLHYYSLSGNLGQIEIDLEKNGKKHAVEVVDDPWKLWVFKISAGTDFEVEKRQNEFSFNTEVNAEKITED